MQFVNAFLTTAQFCLTVALFEPAVNFIQI
jgi:hypothetical protein